MAGQFRADPRRRADIVAQMRHVSVHESPGAEELVARALRKPGEPSGALLHGLASQFARAVEHFNQLPEKLREHYFVRRLQVERRSPRPDRAFVRLRGVAAQLPVSVPRDTIFLAEDPLNGEPTRRYRVRHSAAATGVGLGALTSYRSLADGRDVLRLTLLDGELTNAVSPFPDVSEIEHKSVARSFFIASKLLAAARKGTCLRITFKNVGPSTQEFIEAISSVEWSASSEEDGYRSLGSMSPEPSGNDVIVVFRLGFNIAPFVPPEGVPESEADRVALGCVAAIRLHKPADNLVRAVRDVRTSMAFEEVEMLIEGEDVRVTEALLNGHPLDLNGPFAPFGDPALAGSSLYLACGSVFGLPLEKLGLTFETASGDLKRTTVVSLSEFSDGQGRPVVAWARRRAGQWQGPAGMRWLRPLPTPLKPSGNLEAFGGEVRMQLRHSGSPFSQEHVVDRFSGYWIRARLKRGDFGWSRYLREQEQFMQDVAATKKPSLFKWLLSLVGIAVEDNAPTPPVRPAAPVLARVGVDFRSLPIRAGLHSLWRSIEDTSPVERSQLDDLHCLGVDGIRRFQPFDNRRNGWGGELYLGFRGVTPGAAISLLFDVAHVDSSARSQPEVEFCYFNGSQFLKLPVRDDTRSLTEAGVVRWRAPDDWCSVDWSEAFTVGSVGPMHWLRVRVRQPNRDLLFVRMSCDVTEVEYVPSGPDDSASTRSLAEGVRMLPEVAMPGLVDAELLEPSRGGFGPESARALVERAGRLTRHRNRAISPRDYERLILDEFPAVHLVRCLRHEPPESARRACRQPSWAAVEVPTVRVLLVAESFARFSVLSGAVMDDVRRFLSGRVAAGITVSVESPRFEQVSVRVVVSVTRGWQPQNVQELVRRELVRVMCPQHRTRGGRRQFDRAIAISDLSMAVEVLPGVRHVQSISFLGSWEGQAVIRVDPGTMVTSADRVRHIVEVTP